MSRYRSNINAIISHYRLKQKYDLAYGNLHGFAATFSEDIFGLNLYYSVRFPDGNKRFEVSNALEGLPENKEYGIISAHLYDGFIGITFNSRFFQLSKVIDAVNYLTHLLIDNGATDAYACPVCEKNVDEGRWILVDGIATRIHNECIKELIAKRKKPLTEDKYAYRRGCIGAALGAIISAIICALIMQNRNIAYGFLIPIFTNIGYWLLRGRISMRKIPVISLAAFAGVLLSSICTIAFSLVFDASYTYEGIMAILRNSTYMNVFGAMLKDGLIYSVVSILALTYLTYRKCGHTGIRHLS